MSQIAVAGGVALESAAVTEADFGDLVRENQAMVYSVAYHFLHDGSLAEELAQDVFLHLYKNLDKMESRRHATNWLRRVAGHRCIDYARKKGDSVEVDFESVAEPSSEPGVRDPLLRQHLRKLVASLPEKIGGIYIRAYTFAEEGQYSLDDIKAIRAQMTEPAWAPIVSVQSKKKKEDVQIFFKKNGDKISGVTIIAAEPKELAIMHIVGSISPDDVAKLGGQFGIPDMDLSPKNAEN